MASTAGPSAGGGDGGGGVGDAGGLIARHGTGPGPTLRALASQVHPVFMLPPLAASWFGAVLAGEFDLALGTVHMLAMFAAVYTAHVKDGYVDFHGRGEDDDHPLTVLGCRFGLAAATVLFAACLATVWWFAGPVAAAITLPTWLIGYNHAPTLDMHPVTATVGYPAGIALAILGGHQVQAGSTSAAAVGAAAVFLVTLSGVKIIDDSTDYEYDRSIGKRTVAVAVGLGRSRRLAHWLMGIGAVGVLWLAVDGVFPPAAPAGAVAFGAVAVLARDRGPETATMLLVRGAYLLLAGLVAAVWFRPLAGLPLPDIGVLGPYTYLATEVLFGSVALALLVRAGRDALARAARTVGAVYPVAFFWDWYTLEVGVFSIPLRTGVELFEIPIEEHLFMFVVPGLVLAVHETLGGREGGDGAGVGSRTGPVAGPSGADVEPDAGDGGDADEGGDTDEGGDAGADDDGPTG